MQAKWMLRLCRQRHVDRHRLLVNLLQLLRLLVHLLRDNGVGSRRAHRRLREQLLVVRHSAALRVARLGPRRLHAAPIPLMPVTCCTKRADETACNWLKELTRVLITELQANQFKLQLVVRR